MAAQPPTRDNRGDRPPRPSSASTPAKPAKRLLITTLNKDGTQSFWGAPDVSKNAAFGLSAGAHCMEYSADGSFLAVGGPAGVELRDPETGEVTRTIAQAANPTALTLSPMGTYMLTFQRTTVTVPVTPAPATPDQPPSGDQQPQTKTQVQNQLCAWNLKTGELITTIPQKSFSKDNWKVIKWSENEQICARLVTNEIQFFAPDNLSKCINKLRLENVSAFEWAPTTEGLPTLAVFAPGKKGVLGGVAIAKLTRGDLANGSWDLGQMQRSATAEQAELMWNKGGNSLLALLTSDLDTTGKSYYGMTTLMFFNSSTNFHIQVSLKKEGPIHAVGWAPSGREFAVIYGFMPAKVTVFDHLCNPKADIATGPFNTLLWSPFSRYLGIAGFGTLQGHVELWDVRRLKKCSTWSAPNTARIEWSPDGRYILTATLSPRLRVDNSFKVWSVEGTLLHDEKLEVLYQALWRPAKEGEYDEPRIKFPEIASSPAQPASAPAGVVATTTASPAPAAPAKYRHPHFSGSAEPLIKREEEGEGVFKYKKEGKPDKPPPPPGVISKNALRNKKRRENKKAAKAGADGEGEDGGPEDDTDATTTTTTEAKPAPAPSTAAPTPTPATAPAAASTPAAVEPQQQQQKAPAQSQPHPRGPPTQGHHPRGPGPRDQGRPDSRDNQGRDYQGRSDSRDNQGRPDSRDYQGRPDPRDHHGRPDSRDYQGRSDPRDHHGRPDGRQSRPQNGDRR